MADTKYHILTLNQISSQGLHRFPGLALHRGQDGRSSRRDPGAFARHARHGDSAERQGDRPRRSGHEQHSRCRHVEARRACVQCARRQRQCSEGAGLHRVAAGGAQRDARARLRRGAQARRLATWKRGSRTARSNLPASSCQIARWESSGSAPSAASSPTPRSSSG